MNERTLTDGNDSAFPCAAIDAQGITTREYFAAAALQGLIAKGTVFDADLVAELAVQRADALIKALNQ